MGKWIHVYLWIHCMVESLCYSPETVTTLFISLTPIQNRVFKKIVVQVNLIDKVMFQQRLAGDKGILNSFLKEQNSRLRESSSGIAVSTYISL